MHANSVQKLSTVGTMTPSLDVVSMRACPELANSFAAAGIKVEVEILFCTELMFNGVIEDKLFVRVAINVPNFQEPTPHRFPDLAGSSQCSFFLRFETQLNKDYAELLATEIPVLPEKLWWICNFHVPVSMHAWE